MTAVPEKNLKKKSKEQTTGLSSLERLTWRGFCSRLNTIFQKGALHMTSFGFVSAMTASANTVKHVRRTVAYNHPKIREA